MLRHCLPSGAFAGLLLLVSPLLATPTEPIVVRVYPIADLMVPHQMEGKNQHDAITAEVNHLEQLVLKTIQPKSWECAGGKGNLVYNPILMSLVVAQTPAIHREISDLFTELRKAQNVEVTVEMRFVTVSKEMMAQLGLDGAENRTPGVVMLDDSQLHVLLETVQQDPQANVLQAPKVTTNNGQAARVDLTEQQVYVVGIDFETKDGKKIPKPVTRKVKTGLEFSLLPTVVPDTKRITLQLAIQYGSGDLAADSPNSPRFNTVKLEKMLKMADGTTAMLTGWNQLREVRHEVTSPILSKIPYLCRLFQSTGYGRELETTFVLVTPRIVVNDEGPADFAEEQEAESTTTSEPTINYVNHKSFELSYDVISDGDSNVEGMEVWVTRDGQSWERYPQIVQPRDQRLPTVVKSEGKYGFTLLPRDTAGRTRAKPKAGDEPHVWVVVDETKPTLELYAPNVDVSGNVTVGYLASDNEKLAPTAVSLFWSADVNGPWNPIAEAASAQGEITLPKEKLPEQCYLKAMAFDAAGNTAVVVTPQPVRIPSVSTNVPTITNVKVTVR